MTGPAQNVEHNCFHEFHKYSLEKDPAADQVMWCKSWPLLLDIQLDHRNKEKTSLQVFDLRSLGKNSTLASKNNLCKQLVKAFMDWPSHSLNHWNIFIPNLNIM